MTTIRRESLSEQIATTLRGEILSGELAPGARLPAEPELARRFGTNRNTLREAIRSLEGLHLIAVRHGEGVSVQHFRQTGELSLRPHYLAESADPVEKAEVVLELLELRRFVLGEVAHHAASRASTEEIARLREQVAAVRLLQTSPGPPSPAERVAADVEYYRRLIAAAHSVIYIWMWNTFDRAYTSMAGLLAALWVAPQGYVDQLSRATEAIAARDGELARSIVSAHLAASDLLVLAALGVRRDHE